MEGRFSTVQSPQWAVVPMEEEEVYLLQLCVTYRKKAESKQHIVFTIVIARVPNILGHRETCDRCSDFESEFPFGDFTSCNFPFS